MPLPPRKTELEHIKPTGIKIPVSRLGNYFIPSSPGWGGFSLACMYICFRHFIRVAHRQQLRDEHLPGTFKCGCPIGSAPRDGW